MASANSVSSFGNKPQNFIDLQDSSHTPSVLENSHNDSKNEPSEFKSEFDEFREKISKILEKLSGMKEESDSAIQVLINDIQPQGRPLNSNENFILKSLGNHFHICGSYYNLFKEIDHFYDSLSENDSLISNNHYNLRLRSIKNDASRLESRYHILQKTEGLIESELKAIDRKINIITATALLGVAFLAAFKLILIIPFFLIAYISCAAFYIFSAELLQKYAFLQDISQFEFIQNDIKELKQFFSEIENFPDFKKNNEKNLKISQIKPEEESKTLISIVKTMKKASPFNEKIIKLLSLVLQEENSSQEIKDAFEHIKNRKINSRNIAPQAKKEIHILINNKKAIQETNFSNRNIIKLLSLILKAEDFWPEIRNIINNSQNDNIDLKNTMLSKIS